MRLLIVLAILISSAPAWAEEPVFEDRPRAILESRCFACHGADRVKRKAELDLRSVESILQGGESGPAIAPGKLDESLIWDKITTSEMPPKDSPPLTEDEKSVLKAWILAGAKSKTPVASTGGPSASERDFWSFRRLARPALPVVKNTAQITSPLDHFILAPLEKQGLSLANEADRRTLVRRLYLDLIGLPPTPAQTKAFVEDTAPDAYEKLVDQLLASPQYGERWGRQWLDVVGYADSNGYIRHDSPRPLAYRYRDYVIQSFNEDKPYDQFWQEQLAGDELVRYSETRELSPADLQKLIATHYMRNAPDGTDNTEGSEITRVMERYAVLESQLQITMSAMFGMTIECARCHSHKFDPIPHRDYYSLQAIFYPAFNVKEWVQPKNRWIYSLGQSQLANWKKTNAEIDGEIAGLKKGFENWLVEHPPATTVQFQDDFTADVLATRWSDTAPGDDAVAGSPPVRLDGSDAPAVRVDNAQMAIIAPTSADSTWLSTKQSFDWTPNRIGDSIQATFDLVSSRGANGRPADRIGYYIALCDYNDNGREGAGNLLFDGDPAGGAQVYLDYPGADQRKLDSIGVQGYQPGHNYGVRVTRVGDDEFLLQHLVDGKPENNSLRISGKKLPSGGFGFELCCSRSFVVDNVVVESASDGANGDTSGNSDRAVTARAKKAELAKVIAAAQNRRPPEPEKIAWATDLSPEPPVVNLLKRGDYFQPGPAVEPGPLSVLVDDDNRFDLSTSRGDTKTTGRRLAFARWATKPDSRAAALLARVEADRLWRGHFGRGLVLTPENFGASGVSPTHPELLEWLAAELTDNGWKLKHLHRQIVVSRTYRQTSMADDAAAQADPENLLYGCFPSHRLDAEAIRDSMLAVAGVLNLKSGGPAIDFVDAGNRQIVLPAPKGPGPHEVDRRSVYLRYRRSEPVSFLQVFDQASPDPNCIARSAATVVAQSLAMLNSDFAVRMGHGFAAHLSADGEADIDQLLKRAFETALMREPTATELTRARDFVAAQRQLRSQHNPQDADRQAFADFCRMLMATNEFLQAQ